MLTALQWLLLNNEEWQHKNINLYQVRNNLRNPVLLDNSRHIDGSTEDESNTETTESFQVFFPDGIMLPLTGGQDNLKKNQKLVQAASKNGYDIEYWNEVLKESVSDFKDNNLLNAC